MNMFADYTKDRKKRLLLPLLLAAKYANMDTVVKTPSQIVRNMSCKHRYTNVASAAAAGFKADKDLEINVVLRLLRR